MPATDWQVSLSVFCLLSRPSKSIAKSCENYSIINLLCDPAMGKNSFTVLVSGGSGCCTDGYRCGGSNKNVVIAVANVLVILIINEND